MKSNPEFLKRKYNLHVAPEVESAVKRTAKRTGEKVPQEPAARIQNYLERFKEMVERKDPEKRERGLEAIKTILHDTFVIKPENVPESVFLLEQRLARELGHGDVEISEEFKDRKIKEIISAQEQSLDKWVDYLASADATYPDWAKYWAIRSVLEMGKIKKEQDQSGKESLKFLKRTKDTAAAFPPMNPRALAMAVEAINVVQEEKAKPKEKRQPIKNLSTKLDAGAFHALAATESFPKIYAQFLVEMPEYSAEGLQEVRGKWVTYDRASDPTPLVNSLEGYPLEWCTAAYDTAKTQLEAGDFHVYYSLNQDGKPKIPRAAIRMQENSIAEVRGIAADQNLDPYIGEVVQKKMTEFPDGKEYEKKAADMKRLTELEDKTKKGLKLTKDDLVFLYEIDQPIQGFGYQEDPRIAELRDQRNPKEDAPLVLDCRPDEIAWKKEDVDESTKAYIGPLFPGVFDLNLEHLYTAFPEKKIRNVHLEIGGKTPKQYETELGQKGFRIGDYAKQILAKMKTAKERQALDFVRLTVEDLGFDEVTPYSEICRRAKELGLDLSPAEAGPAFRLSKTDEPIGEWTITAMESLAGSDGALNVFDVGRYGGGRWLDAHGGRPDSQWLPGDAFLFLRRKQLSAP